MPGYAYGGHREPHIIDDTLGFDGVRQYDKSPTLRSERSGLKVAIPCLTSDREEKRQNGRRFKEDGEEMFTLTAQDRHGVAVLTPKRTEYGKEIRKEYEAHKVQEQRKNMTALEPRIDGLCNTLTSVQKDNLVVENEKLN